MDNEEDESHVSTPVASHQPSLSADRIPMQADDPDGIDSFSASLASMLDSTLDTNLDALQPNNVASEPASRMVLLPIPIASEFTMPEVHGEEMEVWLGDLSPEAATADITVGDGGRFVEMSSGAVARELKRLYDQHLGVGKDVRSPFAITAFINQHGKQMYRIGRREMSAPAASGADAEERNTRVQSTVTEGTMPPPHVQSQSGSFHSQARRRSRVSVHSFFKNGAAQPAPKAPAVQDGGRSPPSRRLRRTRSIPNLASLPTSDQSAPSTTPTLLTGRPHAHSVSSVDALRPPSLPAPAIDTSVKAPAYDAFASVMPWSGVPPSPLSSGSGLRSTKSFYSSSDRYHDLAGDDRSMDVIRHPFGGGVTFDTPSLTSSSHLSSTPILREMQSFESGLTARADTSPRSIRLGKLRARLSDESVRHPEEPPAAESEAPELEPEIIDEPLPETLLHSRYSTDLFDVLQNYKGLPILDKIATISDPPTIKLSLKADETAAPKDDPRFVIWGEVDNDDAEGSPASHSATDLSSIQSGLSRRRSAKDRQNMSISEQPFIQIPSNENPKRVVVAATIERWIAQLTSELNYDELLIFFLTYRTYISALDLGHLLICRFHWAISHPASSHDETVKRIVRARTFLAIRYWLLTFFSVDFVPNRELRVLFADWLNALHKDPICTRHKDITNIVQKLRKVVIDCKEAHTQGQATKQGSNRPQLAPGGSVDFSSGDFSKLLRKAVGKDAEDDDIDLDFDDAQSPGVEFGIHVNLSSPSGNPATAVDLAMMRQPLHLAYLQYGKQSAAATQASDLAPVVQLPVSHSAISRVVVNAIGRVGRWKRVLNYRTSNVRAPIRPPLGLGAACVDAKAFDVEASETGDLLLVRGGVEHYLKMVESQRSRKSPAAMSGFQAWGAPPPLGLVPSVTSTVVEVPPSVSPSVTKVVASERDPLEPVEEASDEGIHAETDVADDAAQSTPMPQSPSATTLSSAPPSTVEFRHSFSQDSLARSDPSLRMDVISIDDLELSDMSSEDLHAPPPPPGLRKLPRRLPNRRDFELVRHSVDSVSSMGIRTHSAHDSILSAGSSVTSSVSVPNNAELELGGGIHQWQMDALVGDLSDDEEPGDVEAALRRLEGQINQNRQKQKQSKVDGWVQSIRSRLVNGQFGPGRHRYSSGDEDYGEVQSSRRMSKASASQASSRNSVSSAYSPLGNNVPREEKNNGPAIPPGLEDTVSTAEPKPTVEEGRPAPEDVVPPEILHSRVPSRPSTSAGSPPTETPPPLPVSSPPKAPAPSLFVKPERSLRRHRSFILSYKSEVIAQTFALIDRELFLSLKFEELVSQEWMTSSDDYNVLDWGQYLRDRTVKKAEGRLSVSALAVVRSRFNLTVNFVISEIMLTHPSERLMIFSKFVRIAWKAYTLKNYHLLVAVLAGLDSAWVQKALKQTQSKKPGIWENRMLRDLRQWSTSQDDFKYIRHTVDALAEAKTRTAGSPDPSASSIDGQSTASRSRAASEGKPPSPPACVPFFGVYLSQLYRYSNLPDLIDPTAPHLPVGIDPVTNIFESPAHPEVFSYLAPLPPSVQLEPLINVHKQRLVAGVVKSFVAGQHLAAKVNYTTDKKLFQKCFKLRGLDPGTLERVLALYSNWVS